MKPIKYLIAITVAILFTLLLNAQSENNKLELVQTTKTSLQCFEDSISDVAHRESAVCSLPLDNGPCNGNCTRWYYSGDIQGCLPFAWGCCGGNANNFATYEACMNSCGSNSCPLYVDLGNKSINTANIEAKQQIIHSGGIFSNQQVQFEAGDRISLKSGFRTGNSEFKARIDNSCELVITDCANNSVCLAYTGGTGQANQDLFGEFVMPYDDCLLNNIPGAVNNINIPPPIIFGNPVDSIILDDGTSFNCKIPFYAGIDLGYTQVMPGIDSIEASLSLNFNSFYDGINNKILAIELIINGESIKCNDKTVDFYVKTGNSIINDVICIFYSTDFTNVYVNDFSFSFTLGIGIDFFNEIFIPVYSSSNNTIDYNSFDILCKCNGVECAPTTIALIFPFSG